MSKFKVIFDRLIESEFVKCKWCNKDITGKVGTKMGTKNGPAFCDNECMDEYKESRNDRD